jgi:hypothetical protein
MVARIIKGKSLSNTLNYNEHKVQLRDAECIHSANYAKDTDQLNFYDKLRRLEHQAALNQNVKANSVHISLNFDSADQLDKQKLVAIADSYMQQIGFGSQPYLVYQHTDAGHQHIHIVTTNIQASGKRIDMNNIGRNESEKARKAIEKEFGLVPAESHKQEQKQPLKQELVVPIHRVEYGKTETKRAMQNVLDFVIRQYKFTSLPELNAVLKQYNVMADRGKEGSHIHKNGGLVYRVLDANGNKIGVPIKASAFYNKPTIKTLEKLFLKNEVLREGFRAKLKTVIDVAIVTKKPTLHDLKDLLKREGISTELRINETGLIYGITYVDHRTKCVFNGSDLGKEYSAKGIQQRCRQLDQKLEESEKLENRQKITGQHQTHHTTDRTAMKEKTSTVSLQEEAKEQAFQKAANLLAIMMKPEENSQSINPEWLRKKKRKKHKLGLQ